VHSRRTRFGGVQRRFRRSIRRCDCIPYENRVQWSAMPNESVAAIIIIP
jgi:hypothetical protein